MLPSIIAASWGNSLRLAKNGFCLSNAKDLLYLGDISACCSGYQNNKLPKVAQTAVEGKYLIPEQAFFDHCGLLGLKRVLAS